ncbi:MAG: helix-turn-helix transcriptional regulator [Solirubrobacterales bacterium]|nr:helix-turn-helix transcriptional regulator [Solirubrobacterales bacterium]
MLAQRAQAELLATGARPRRLARSGVEALTPSERRIARLAADGLSTPEIAQQLFVTVNTVETHLRHAYMKLDIHSREQLPGIFGAAELANAQRSPPRAVPPVPPSEARGPP